MAKKQIIEDFKKRRRSIIEIYGEEKHMKMYLKQMLDLMFNIQMEILKQK